MAKILFETLTYQNLKSVGNSPITLDFRKHKTTLWSGKNGSGKSGNINALCFVLFGRGYGDINKPALVNTINQKNLLCTITFSVGSKKYRVVRGIKPNIFEIWENDSLINQDPSVKDYQSVLEKQILGVNYRAFTQIVVVGGSEYVPFMKLDAKNRREFVEDLLDIRVFSTMNLMVKDNLKSLKDELKDLTIIMKAHKSKISLQESFVRKMQAEKAESTDKIVSQIKEIQDNIGKYNAQLDVLTGNLKRYAVDVEKHNDLDDQLSNIRISCKQLSEHLNQHIKSKLKYEDMHECPTCTQTIGADHKTNIISNIQSIIADVEGDIQEWKSKENAIRSAMSEYQQSIQLYSDTQREIQKINTLIFSDNYSWKNANDRLSEIQNNVVNIDEEKTKLKEFAKEYVGYDKRRKKILSDQQYQEFIQEILSDSGIRSKVIKQYIPTINMLINKYLDDMGFFVSFHLSETFEETIKSRHRDTFTYEHFSDGQRRRIDIAILLTWMTIAKAKNALSCNLLILDEIDAALDASGADMMHSLLKICPADNIFLISHKGDLLSDKVDNVIEFELKNGFTQVVV